MVEKKKISLSQLKQAVIVARRMFGILLDVDRRLVLICLVAYLMPGILPFVNAYVYKLIIDIVVNAASGKPVLFTHLYFLIGIRFLTFFVQDAFFRIQEYTGRVLWVKVPMEISRRLYTKLASLDVQYFEDSEFKDLLEKARDAQFKSQNLVDGVLYAMQSLVEVIIALVALVALNPLLSIIIGFIAFAGFRLQLQQSKAVWGIWDWHSPLRKKFWYVQRLLEEKDSIKEIKIFQLGDKFVSDMRHIQEVFYKENQKVVTQNTIKTVELNILGTGVFVGIEVYVIFRAIARKVTVGDIGFYTGVINNFQNGLSGFFRNLTNIFENSLYVKNLFELLDTEPLLSYATQPESLTITKPPVIEFRDVTFGYPGSKTKILKNFSLTIHPGEKIAFVGENGAGKSTLIKLLARFYDVEEGEILINDVNIKDLDLAEWHRVLGVLFQDFNRYEYLVKENIAFGDLRRPTDQEEIAKAARESGADDVVDSLEKKYDQMLGKTFDEGVELSAGQWQKIALARGFYRNAPVLILDEPTASIDAKAESEIFSRVEKLSRDKSVIIISHRFSTVRNADRIIVIKKGKIVEEGSHEKLVQEKGLYAELFELQAKGYK